MSKTLEEIGFLLLRMITPQFDCRYATALAGFRPVTILLMIVALGVWRRYRKYAIRELEQCCSKTCGKLKRVRGVSLCRGYMRGFSRQIDYDYPLSERSIGKPQP